jgi:peroxiredoxin 2/4
MLAHDRRMEAFKQRGVEVVGLSIDSQFTEQHGEVCPAGWNWNKGDEGMNATSDGVADYLAANAEKL